MFPTFPGEDTISELCMPMPVNLKKQLSHTGLLLKIDNLFYMAKVNLATVYNQQGKNDEAERLLREVLNENPEIYQVNYSLALLLAEKGNIAESRNYFLKAAALLPDQPRIIYNLALLENSQGNKALAEEYLLKALKKEPDNYDFLYAICYFLP